VSRGEQLGRYRVLELIGQGGMGTVHLGEHELLRHQVAIKILHDRHTRDPAMERRFYNEARAIAALDHPGIVKLFDIGRAGDGRAYLVMELLRGETLRQRIGVRGMTRSQLLPFALQVASALAAAHESGIVHRDVKPENVFIVRDPDIEGGERAKILDFGVAKRTHLTATPSPEITRAGVLLGTPAYMAPEQCRGDDHIDARADIYAFGVLLYEMISGALPFASTHTEEVLSKQLYCAPPPLPPGLDASGELIAIIERCMAKSPRDRFPTMSEVGDALERLDASSDTDPTAQHSIAATADDFLDMETLPRMAAYLEDRTTGVVLPELVAEPTTRGRAVVRVGATIAALAAVAVALLIVLATRGGEPAPTVRESAPIERAARVESESRAADPARAPVTRASNSEPAPRPRARTTTSAAAPAPARRAPARAATRMTTKRPARKPPAAAARPSKPPGDAFAEIEAPVVF
jgi:serine/threonine-protein kinase